MAKSPINFNIYEVLEPLKCTAKDENVGILIDISDEVSENLTGSHLDSIKKSEFDLVDLYQNIYVTPQQVKIPKQERITSANKDLQKSQGNKENKLQNALKPLDEADINELLSKSDRDETDGLELSDYMSNDIIYQYNIPKVLKVPTLYDSDSNINLNTVTNDIETKLPESIKLKTDYHDYIEKLGKDLVEKRMESNHNQTNFTVSNVLPGRKSADCDNDILQKVARDLMAKKRTESTLQNVGVDQNIVNSTLTLNKLPKVENFETLQTAKLDKKLYARQRQTKSERERVLYTKGPDLYEKSVVLPQIMKRLAARKQELDEVKFTRRLILDSGKRSPECSCQCSNKMQLNSTNEPKESMKGNESPKVRKEFISPAGNPSEVDTEAGLSPIVAMEDCNKERLIAHRVRSAFERFVRTGSYF